MRYAVDAPEVNETLTMIQRLCANLSLPNMKNYLGRVDVLEEREQLEADLGVTRQSQAAEVPASEEAAAPKRQRRQQS